ncbi:MAG: LacI family DNA-binding transcriptional regulator [Lentisphaerota bacterium]
MVTMKEIALKSGVTQPTVSVVLNNKKTTVRISPVTRAKILATAESMGYRVNEIARSVKTGKTNTIGVIGVLCSFHCMEIINGISETASARNCTLKLWPCSTLEEVKSAARKCAEQRLGGVICRSLTEEELTAVQTEFKQFGIPVVILVGSGFIPDGCSSVNSGEFDGAVKAVEYLRHLGHCRIGYVTTRYSGKFNERRLNGYIEAMRRNGGQEKSIQVVEISNNDLLPEGDKIKLLAFIRRNRLTACFCGADSLAMKVAYVAEAAGFRIPEDLSIVGFGGTDYSAFANPPLTTVHESFREMGRQAARVLIQTMENPNFPAEKVEIATELVIRSTCAKPNLNSISKTKQGERNETQR